MLQCDDFLPPLVSSRSNLIIQIYPIQPTKGETHDSYQLFLSGGGRPGGRSACGRESTGRGVAQTGRLRRVRRLPERDPAGRAVLMRNVAGRSLAGRAHEVGAVREVRRHDEGRREVLDRAVRPEKMRFIRSFRLTRRI